VEAAEGFTVKLFIDTEFTDFSRPDLISIGIVSEDGREFYGERNDFLQVRCSDFVRKVILPQLGHTPDNVYTLPALKGALLEWLKQFTSEAQTIICSNLDDDWVLLTKLLGNDIPRSITYRNIEHNIDDGRLKEYFQASSLTEHHALNDARACRYAYIEARLP
jgi:hypothetical protein